MSKDITELFTKKFDEDYKLFHITARNYNTHIFSLGKNDICLTISQLRELGKWISETTEKISNDPDFNPQNK
jgi:hypothetical protein